MTENEMLEQELSQDPIACDEGPNCRNSPQNTQVPLCSKCRLCPNNLEDISTMSYWSPNFRGLKHPILEKWKHEKAKNRRELRALSRQGKSRKIQARLRHAEAAERNTEEVIMATANSGRKSRDGDHVSFGVTLDTKDQSNRIRPVINWHELDKVRRDATRSGHAVGGLVLQSANQRSAVIIALEDWVILMRQTEQQ